MDNFKAVYKILAALEAGMDQPQFDAEQIAPEVLGVSKERWAKYLQMMQDVGYISGVEVHTYITGVSVNTRSIAITLKGLEYLQENSMMQKAYRAIKGIRDIVPGI